MLLFLFFFLIIALIASDCWAISHLQELGKLWGSDHTDTLSVAGALGETDQFFSKVAAFVDF